MWDVLVRREVRPAIDALKGKKTGYAETYAQLERNPCLVHPPPPGEDEGRPFAYRVAGPLGKKVCGTHLRRDHRLAFSMQDPDRKGIEGTVIVLYAGVRDARDRSKDTLAIVHDLFGVESPAEDHLRPPCCQDGRPAIDEDKLEEFMNRLRRFLRGR